MEEKNEKKYCVYMHRNKVNNKVYIGQTGTSVEDRWQNGRGYKGCTLFERAIQKYGWDNFEHIILEDNLTREEVGKSESRLIALYDATNPEKGYNISTGGESGHTGVKMSDEIRAKMSEARKGVPFSEEHKNRISVALKGRTIPQETIDKARLAKGDYFVQLDFDGNLIKEYFTTWDAYQQTGVTQDAIASALNKNSKRKTAGGFVWIKSNEYYDINFVFKKENYTSSRLRSVVQLDIYGKYINTFESCRAAERAMGKNGSVINACCRGDIHTAYGYVWVYADEYELNKDYSIYKKSIWNQYAVIQLDEQFNVITEFPSANEAHKRTNISLTCICECCNGIQRTAGGFFWLKKEDYETICLSKYDIKEMYDKIKKNNSSDTEAYICDYDGVHWSKRSKKWEATITINGKVKSIGRFIDMQEAINARKLAEIEKELQEGNQEYKMQINNKSGCTGVCWDKKCNKWMSTLRYNNNIYYLGRFISKEDAIYARLNKEIELYGYDKAPQRHLFEQYGITTQNE